LAPYSAKAPPLLLSLMSGPPFNVHTSAVAAMVYQLVRSIGDQTIRSKFWRGFLI
jgi:hypothetical protein